MLVFTLRGCSLSIIDVMRIVYLDDKLYFFDEKTTKAINFIKKKKETIASINCDLLNDNVYIYLKIDILNPDEETTSFLNTI